MHELILASGSSRRHSLLAQLNQEYRVCVSNIDESIVKDELPDDYVCRMAREKALAVAQLIMLENSQQSNKESLLGQAILAADTIIAFDGEILGKPKDIQDARDTMHKLSGKEHEVLTALCLKYKNDVYQTLVRTNVKFRLLSNKEIEAYCLSEEPYDKAGGYAIQGAAASFVEYISGSYTNVVGLPLVAVYMLLNQAKLYRGE